MVYSANVPRAVRVAAIGTATLTTMFLNALLYDVVGTGGSVSEPTLVNLCRFPLTHSSHSLQAFPDSHPCASYSTKSECLEEASTYYANKKMCTWDATSQSCSFNQPSSDFFTIVLISIATSIVSTPVLTFMGMVGAFMPCHNLQ